MKIFRTCADYLLECGAYVMLGFLADANMARSGMMHCARLVRPHPRRAGLEQLPRGVRYGAHRHRIDARLRSAQRRDPPRLPGHDRDSGRPSRRKNVPPSRATHLATHVWSSVEGALTLSRVLRSPEPFDLAIAQLAATAEAEADASVS